MPYHTKNKKRKKVHTAKFDRCVMGVKKSKTKANAYAVCTKALGKKAFLKKSRKKK